MRPKLLAIPILAMSGKARRVEVKHRALTRHPLALAAAFEAVMHMTCDDGAEIPAACDDLIDGEPKIGIAKITFFRAKIAAVDRVAALAEAGRAVMREDDERERAIGFIKLRHDLRRALFHGSHAIAGFEIACEGEAPPAKRMRTRCEHLEAELREKVQPISFTRHMPKGRLDAPYAASLIFARKERAERLFPRDLGEELRNADSVVIPRDCDGACLHTADDRAHPRGLLRPESSEIADEEQEVVMARVERARFRHVKLSVDIADDAEGCHRVGALLYTSSMRPLIVITMLAGLSPTQTNEGAMEEEAPECAKVRGEARYQGLGYTHFAIVKNECASAVACDLYSDVDPKSRHRALVPAGKTHEEALRRGSPASAFKVGYRCEARGALATP